MNVAVPAGATATAYDDDEDAFSDVNNHNGGEVGPADVAFVLRPPFEKDEIFAVEGRIRAAVEEGMRVLDEGGADAFVERYMSKKKEGGGNGSERVVTDNEADVYSEGKSDSSYFSDEEADAARKIAIVEGAPRMYQIGFFEKCKAANTIVHLGTGQGKTLIALLCMKHFLRDLDSSRVPDGQTETTRLIDSATPRSDEKQAWFLVPSVALAVQHTVTIRANLPNFRVATACTTSSFSEKSRMALARAHIVIATHGSALDLLRHYNDIFYLSRVSILIFDECHYATGNHGYAQLLETFYHPMHAQDRPRIVGLTASPIINVGKDASPSRLENLLSEVERMLDSKIVCFSDLGEPSEECLATIRRNVEEKVLCYDNSEIKYDPIPLNEIIVLHPSRKKELKQIQKLYDDLGPCVTGKYCANLATEISKSAFEGETVEQFRSLVCFLKRLSSFCAQQCEGIEKGRSQKMILLEELLCEMLTKTENSDGVGLVFVERRITAMALHGYLQKSRVNCGNSDATVRCDCLVRQAQQIFKYLNPRHKMGDAKYRAIMEQSRHEWLHQTKKIRSVLDKLRRKEINLLIATSVVEEGVDVSACSFVIVLDGIKTTKSYVQMKGRARKKNAKFFCFRDVGLKETTVPLEDARKIEDEVSAFLKQRAESVVLGKARHMYPGTATTSTSEESAIFSGEYRTAYALVNLRSAKSLLNHYFLSVPMDPSARASKDAIRFQLPRFEDAFLLLLPAHLPPEMRTCTLPKACMILSKKTKENVLALMAIVRLHQRGLINDRLLPLKRNDLHKILLERVLLELPEPHVFADCTRMPVAEGDKLVAYLYPLAQEGDLFDQHSDVMGSHSRQLGFVFLSKLSDQPLSVMSFDHPELGIVRCEIGQGTEVRIDASQWKACSDFFEIVLNARWRRRTGRTYFCYDSTSTSDDFVPAYAIVVLAEDGKMDWRRMREAATDYHRSEEERIAAAKGASSKQHCRPRMWAPRYSPNSRYIAFSSSQLTCSAPFPDVRYKTYCDYMLQKHSFQVDPDCDMYVAQISWTEPVNLTPISLCQFSKDRGQQKRQKVSAIGNERCLQEGECSPCKDLRAVLLPQDACMEAIFADASLYLHCLLLPQILYELERRILAASFVTHCCKHYPRLGARMNKLDLTSVAEAFTAKSCTLENTSYDRLEYIGDAVLKLLHTNALLESSALQQWTKCLHEGDLSKLRSEMGSNERLSLAARSAGIDRFILTMPLERGKWQPNGFVRKYRDQDYASAADKLVLMDTIVPSTKVLADVVEALIGLIYTEYGFEAAAEVAEELLISIPCRNEEVARSSTDRVVDTGVDVDPLLLTKIEKFLGGKKFKNPSLVKEAVTHASKLFADVPSYQKLEWVGDAVLCLAARDWVYRSFPSLPVAKLVVIETTIVCNETLSCLSARNGLHGCVEFHDASLPGRFESFVLGLRGEEWGLWGSDSPKVLADVVEALIGASHVDGGVSAGQASALFVVNPVLNAISEAFRMDDDTGGDLKVNEGMMMHPKQFLSEMANFLKIRVCAEVDIADEAYDMWQRKTWIKPNVHGDQTVCHVSCFGLHLAAIAGPSKIVARNRGCAIVSHVLNCNPDLMKKMNEISTKVAMKQLSFNSNGKRMYT